MVLTSFLSVSVSSAVSLKDKVTVTEFNCLLKITEKKIDKIFERIVFKMFASGNEELVWRDEKQSEPWACPGILQVECSGCVGRTGTHTGLSSLPE